MMGVRGEGLGKEWGWGCRGEGVRSVGVRVRGMKNENSVCV